MHTIDEVLGEVARTATLEAQIETLIAAGGVDATKVDQAFTDLKAANDKLDAVVNPPAPPVVPVP